MAKKKKTSAFVNIVAGGIGGSLAKTAMAPFERLKMLQQTGGGTMTNSVMQNFRGIIQASGVSGFWRGNFVNCLRIFPNRGILFATQEFFKENVFGTSRTAGTAAGGAAGLVSTVATYPMDLLRTRMQGIHMKETISEVVFNTYKRQGLAGYYRGMAVTIATIVPFQALSFGVYEAMRDLEMHAILSGAISGAVSGTAIYPLDTLRRIFQTTGNEMMAKYDNSAIAVSKELIREGGILRLYKGAGMNLIRIAGQQAVVFGTYESIKDAVRNFERTRQNKSTKQLQQNKIESPLSRPRVYTMW